MADFNELWPGGPSFSDGGFFGLCTDSVLLADFARAKESERGIDLGCGAGAVSLLILARGGSAHLTGLEINPEAAKTAAINMKNNALSASFEAVSGDIRDYKALFKAGQFDFAVSNPPYFAAGRGYAAKGKRAKARQEEGFTLDEMCAAAQYLVRSGGALYLVHRPERLAEIFSAMQGHALEPKRLRTVHHSPDRAPSLVLIEARRDGAPGLKFDPPLTLHTPDGGDSEQARRIYRLNEGGAGE